MRVIGGREIEGPRVLVNPEVETAEVVLGSATSVLQPCQVLQSDCITSATEDRLQLLITEKLDGSSIFTQNEVSSEILFVRGS